jgi:hypothetical protein
MLNLAILIFCFLINLYFYQTECFYLSLYTKPNYYYKSNPLNVVKKNIEKNKNYSDKNSDKKKSVNNNNNNNNSDEEIDLSQLVKLGDEERLQKLIARSGISSRRGAESLVSHEIYYFC